jgi:hypothetical protein
LCRENLWSAFCGRENFGRRWQGTITLPLQNSVYLVNKLYINGLASLLVDRTKARAAICTAIGVDEASPWAARSATRRHARFRAGGEPAQRRSYAAKSRPGLTMVAKIIEALYALCTAPIPRQSRASFGLHSCTPIAAMPATGHGCELARRFDHVASVGTRAGRSVEVADRVRHGRPGRFGTDLDRGSRLDSSP